MESTEPRPSYQEESRQARNAEESLLAALSACALALGESSQIPWPDNDDARSSFGYWIGRLGSAPGVSRTPLYLECLPLLHLEGLRFNVANLQGANFAETYLAGANPEIEEDTLPSISEEGHPSEA